MPPKRLWRNTLLLYLYEVQLISVVRTAMTVLCGLFGPWGIWGRISSWVWHNSLICSIKPKYYDLQCANKHLSLVAFAPLLLVSRSLPIRMAFQCPLLTLLSRSLYHMLRYKSAHINLRTSNWQKFTISVNSHINSNGWRKPLVSTFCSEVANRSGRKAISWFCMLTADTFRTATELKQFHSLKAIQKTLSNRLHWFSSGTSRSNNYGCQCCLSKCW